MRQTTSSYDNSILESVTKFGARLTLYKSRTFFDEYTGTAWPYAAPAGEITYPLAEAAGFNTAIDSLVTVAVTRAGTLTLSVWDYAAVIPELEGNPISADPTCRPAIFENQIYYYASGHWYVSEFSPSLLNDDDVGCIVGQAQLLHEQKGTCHAVGVDRAVFLHIDGGAVRITYMDDQRVMHESPGRMFIPTEVMKVTDEKHLYGLHYSGAASLSASKTFVYYSRHDGSVTGIQITEEPDGGDVAVMWGEFFTAIPADLCVTKLNNAFAYNGKVFLCGRFSRLEWMESDIAYTLLTSSVDGIVFTLDRRILVSMLDYRWNCYFGNGDIIFGSSGRTHVEPASYRFLGDNADSIVVKLISASGSGASGFQCKAVAGEEQWFDHAYMDTGTFAKLEVGMEIETGEVEFITYHDLVLARIGKGWVDGERDLSLSLIGDGLWHTGQMTHPFYLELMGKQGFIDDALTEGHLAVMAGNGGSKWGLGVDFWTADGNAFTNKGNTPAQEQEFFSADLLTYCTEYPIIGEETNYDFYIYGWSRGGKQDTNPNTPDDSDTDTLNDEFFPMIEIEIDGVTSIIDGEGWTRQSDNANFPQTYFTPAARAGDYPIIYTMPNPGAGAKIKRIGAKVINPNSIQGGNTIFNLERVEIPDIPAFYSAPSTGQPGFTIDATAKDKKWAIFDRFTLQITDGNAADGDIELGSIPTRAGYVYTAVVVGDVRFKRSGIEYLQDARFTSSMEVSADYTPPKWGRVYPPGNAETQHSSVVLTAGSAFLPQQQLTDNIPPMTEVSPTHGYALNFDESGIYQASSIDPHYVPYFYGDGNVVSAALFLDGTGAISDIVGGLFDIFIFECPEPLEDFIGAGGISGTFQEIDGGGALIGDPMSTYTKGYSFGAPYNDSPWFAEFHKRFRVLSSFATVSIHLNQITQQVADGYGGVNWQNQWIANEINGDRVYMWENPHVPDPAQWHNYELTHEKILTLVAGDIIDLKIDYWWNNPNSLILGGFIGQFKEMLISTFSSANAIVPEPPYFNLSVPGSSSGDWDSTVISSTGTDAYLTNVKKGEQQVVFATKPGNAWNFDIITRWTFGGDYSVCGSLGLADASKNYIVGWVRKGFYGISKFRNGLEEIIVSSANADLETNKTYDVRFWHRDGLFGIETKRAQDYTWPHRGSQLLYEWAEYDDAICMTDDIYHVGIYSMIDPPKFRTTGFSYGSQYIGVMPPDVNPTGDGSSDPGLASLPASGVIELMGKKFNYTHKVVPLDATQILGPFHLRNADEWNPPFNTDPDKSFTYIGGRAVEFLNFRWLPGTTDWDTLAGTLITAGGFTWGVQQTQWKVWITTGGAMVLLRNRARVYSATMPDFYPGGNERVYLTNGIGGITAVDATSQDEYTTYPFGSFAYMDTDDFVKLRGYIAFSGDPEMSVSSMIAKMCQIAGTEARFPGNHVILDLELLDQEEESV